MAIVRPTGATIRAAMRVIRAQRPGRLVLATSVAPSDVLRDLAGEVDEIICLSSPPDFTSVSRSCTSFDQVSDAEVVNVLGRFE